MTNKTENAIATAMANMPAEIAYDARHPNYKYASADAVFSMVREAFFSAGLTLWIDEIRFEVVEKSGRMFIDACYGLAITTDTEKPKVSSPGFSKAGGDHRPGIDLWALYEKSSIFVPYLGPQSCQAARTYAVKYWLRTKALLATGEGDMDDPAQNPPDQSTPAPNAAPETPRGRWIFSKGKYISQAGADGALLFERLMRDFSAEKDYTIPDLRERARQVYSDNIDMIENTLSAMDMQKFMAHLTQIDIFTDEEETAP